MLATGFSAEPKFTLRRARREHDVSKMFNLLAQSLVCAILKSRCPIALRAGDRDQDILLRPAHPLIFFTELIEAYLELFGAVAKR